jgi:hypothetical protein
MKKCRKKQKKRVHMECHIFYYHAINVTNMIIAIYFGNLKKAKPNTMAKYRGKYKKCRECKHVKEIRQKFWGEEGILVEIWEVV